jgi:hypothetical protein
LELTRLAPTLIDRLLVLEQRAAHAHAVAAVAEHLAWRERQEADAAQRLLSEVKIFLALLPDDAKLELRAPKPAAASPPEVLGVRPHLGPEARCRGRAPRSFAGGWGHRRPSRLLAQARSAGFLLDTGWTQSRPVGVTS